MQLSAFIAIDDGVAVAGQLANEGIIISAALDVAGEASDEEDPCNVLRPMRRTAKEAADAVFLLEGFCYDVPGNTFALEG